MAWRSWRLAVAPGLVADRPFGACFRFRHRRHHKNESFFMSDGTAAFSPYFKTKKLKNYHETTESDSMDFF